MEIETKIDLVRSFLSYLKQDNLKISGENCCRKINGKKDIDSLEIFQSLWKFAPSVWRNVTVTDLEVIMKDCWKASQRPAENSSFPVIDREEQAAAILKCIYVRIAGEDNASGYLVNRENNKVTKFHEEEITHYVPKKSDNPSFSDFWQNKTIPGIEAYDPVRPDVVWFEQRDVGVISAYVNTYQRPHWKDKDISNFPMPEIVSRLFEHVFPKEACREYVYDWCARSLMYTNKCYLFLRGDKRVGKNTVMTLLSKLHGTSNYFVRVDDKAYHDFDGDVANKTLGLFDEITIKTPTEYNKIKKYINDTLPIRSLFKESVVRRNYASIAISLNPDSNISAMDPGDERFSMPYVTREKLRLSFTPEEIQMLVEPPEEIINGFANFLINRQIMSVNNVPYHDTEKELEAMIGTLPEIFLEFFECCYEESVKENLLDTPSDKQEFATKISCRIVERAVRKMNSRVGPMQKRMTCQRIIRLFENRPALGMVTGGRPYGSIYLRVKLHSIVSKSGGINE